MAWRSRAAGLYDLVGGEREGDPVAPEQPLRGNVILIVDDDADSVAALERLIAEAFGCRVLTASSGDEALARYRLGPARRLGVRGCRHARNGRRDTCSPDRAGGCQTFRSCSSPVARTW